MSIEDIKRIEVALGITLPAAYTKVMTDFPIPAYAQNSETMIWDDADALIRLNRELRQGRGFVKPWPTRFFALGKDSGGCSDALDLNDPELGVFWFDRQHIDVCEGDRSPEKIEQWLTRQVRDLTADLVGEGIDPMTSALTRKQSEQSNYRSSNLGMMLFFGIVAVALVAGIWIGLAM